MKFISLLCLAVLTGFLVEGYSSPRPEDERMVAKGDRGSEINPASQTEVACPADQFNTTHDPGWGPDLILERSTNSILVQVTGGYEGEICLELSGWDLDRQILVIAYDEEGFPIGEVPCHIQTDNLFFSYQQTLGGKAVEFYDVTQDPLEPGTSEHNPGLPPAWMNFLPFVFLVIFGLYASLKRR